MEDLRIAMERKGWTIAQTARRSCVTDQCLRNLLGEGATRPTVPANVSAVTMVRLLEVFDDLDADSFVPGAKITVSYK